jgi:hypothetical protein
MAEPNQPSRRIPMRNRTSLWLLLAGFLILGVTAIGCLNRDLAPADPSTQSGVFVEITQTGTTKVDLLFMVDNSNSMQEEQTVLAEQIVVLTQELIHPSGEGPDAPPAVQDLHIGIITSDMGTHGYSIMTCNNPMNGDNGVLQNIGRLPGCQPTYSARDCSRAECPWLEHSADAPDDGTDPSNPPIWDDFGCIATLGTGGCGFEQQLEASLVAVTTQAEPGRPNEGFIRPDSLIAIIYVTDEDDCSTGNGEMFNPTREDFGPMNVRCALNPTQLYEISRYHDAFVGLRPGNEDLVVVAAITGIPVDGSWNPGDDIQGLRDMQQVNPSNPNELLTSCQTGMGMAFPPVRIVELVYSFGNNGILASICQSDWRPALEAITRKIQSKLTGACMTRQLASTDPGVCRVIETLNTDAACPYPANGVGGDRTSGWHMDLGVNDEGFRQCEILAADYDGDGCPDGITPEQCAAEAFGPGTSALQGWFYDNDDPNCEFGQVRFTSPDITSDLSDVRFECRTALCPLRRQCPDALSDESCNPNEEGACGGGGRCVRHNSDAICTAAEGGACARCSPTLASSCDLIAADCAEDPGHEYRYGCGLALIQEGGCCAEGFHCEEICEQSGVCHDECRADRTTRCDAN